MTEATIKCPDEAALTVHRLDQARALQFGQRMPGRTAGDAVPLHLEAADPVRFRSRLWLRDSAGHRMGQVVSLDGVAPGAPGNLEALLSLDRAQPHWQLCWVVNGERRSPIATP